MTDLVTLEDYKDSVGISTTKEDTRLTILVASVSALVKTYCGRSFVDFASSNKTEVFNVTHNISVLQLTEFPVIAITTVKERAGYSSSYTTLTEASFEYYLDTDTDAVVRTDGSAGFLNWPKGPASVEVVYTGGYVTLPTDLDLAIYDLLTYYHKNEYKEQKVILSSTIRNRTVSSQVNSADFPDHIKRVLDFYRVI